MRPAGALLFTAVMLAAAAPVSRHSIAAQAPAPRPARPAAAAPRLPPVQERQWTQQQRELAGAYVRTPPVTNDIRVLLNHPDLLPGVMPFWNYVNSESTLPRHDRLLLILRTALRSRSRYLWARYAAAGDGTPAAHAPEAALAAATDLAQLDPFDAALIRAADALHRTSFIDDATWAALKARYGTEQLMDAVFTVAEMSMWSMSMNSLRVPLESAFTSPLPAAPPAGAAREHPVLDTPRIPPLEPTFWTGELRVLLDPDATGRDIAAIYRTFARHPALYEPRQQLSEYIRLKATLPARARELAILRIGALCGSDYEWAAHVPAARSAGLSAEEIDRIALGGDGGWKAADAAVLHAVDELYRGDEITDATWQRLAAHLDRRQILDLLVTTGGYRMVSMALNTFGVPLEPGSVRIPRRAAPIRP